MDASIEQKPALVFWRLPPRCLEVFTAWRDERVDSHVECEDAAEGRDDAVGVQEGGEVAEVLCDGPSRAGRGEGSVRFEERVGGGEGGGDGFLGENVFLGGEGG